MNLTEEIKESLKKYKESSLNGILINWTGFNRPYIAQVLSELKLQEIRYKKEITKQDLLELFSRLYFYIYSDSRNLEKRLNNLENVLLGMYKKNNGFQVFSLNKTDNLILEQLYQITDSILNKIKINKCKHKKRIDLISLLACIYRILKEN